MNHLWILLIAFATPALASPVLDLSFAREVGMQTLRAQLAPEGQLQESGFYFVDGATQTEEALVCDLGRVYFLAQLSPARTPLPGVLAAYTIGLNGEESVKFVKLTGSSISVYSPDGSAVLRTGLSADQLEGLRRDFGNAFPQAQLQFLEQLGLILFNDPANTAAIFNFLKARPEVQSVDLDAEMYPIPFQFGNAVRLDSAGSVDLGDPKLRVVHDQLATQFTTTGQKFLTLPSLPKSVGGFGPIPNP